MWQENCTYQDVVVGECVTHRSRRTARGWFRYKQASIQAAIGVGLLSLCFMLAYFLRPSPSGNTFQYYAVANPSVAQGDSGQDFNTLLEPSGASRVVYPYSVVPGGVRTPKELQDATKRDPLVARHYSGFNFSNAHVVELQKPQLVYVSYRLKGKIYWTKKKVALHKGEKVITDGKITGRTRCANQVSPTAQAAVS